MVTHIERTPVDPGLALRQWEAYVAALADAGWHCIEVDPIDECPDSVFVEDIVVMFGRTAVITRPGAEQRRPERDAVAATVTELGYRVVSIEAPGTLDGGDVLKIGNTAYVGSGGRTNEAGIGQLRTLVEPLGFEVVAIPVTKVLHLKSAVTALPDGRVIGYPPLVAGFEDVVAVPEPTGSLVVDLGNDRLLMAASAPRTAELLTELGYRPIRVDISEFERLEACVTCLSVRLRD
jgi:dimethylargininase